MSYEPDNINDWDRELERSIDTVCGSLRQKFNTISLAKRALDEGVPGDFAECGVAGGTQVALMARVLQHYGDREDAERKVHLFDSFSKGFSVEHFHTEADTSKLPTLMSPTVYTCEPTGEVMTTIEQVANNMSRWAVDPKLLVYHDGWVQKTIPQLVASDGLPQLALLRLDVDFFSPTKVIFDYLYDRVSPGGYIISDDWGEYELDHPHPIGCRLAAKLFFENRRLPFPKVERVADGTVWWRKP